MQEIVNYFAAHNDAFWYVLGGGMLVLEALVLGLSTGILLFTGIGAMLTGLAVSLGFGTTKEEQIIIFGITSVLVTAILWKPFKSLQKTKSTQDTSSDMIGMTVKLTAEATRSKSGTIRWSSIDWKAELDKSCPKDSIAEGEDVTVTAVTAGKMTITVEE